VDYVGSLRKEGSLPSLPSPISHKRAASEAGKAGKTMVDDIVLPILQKAIHDDMDAREIESLSMLSRGFSELKEVNPELAYNVILDILSGINDNSNVRQHIQTTRGLFPHKKIVRRSEMTSRGLVVTEEEEITGLPMSRTATPSPPPEANRKSPIADLLYMRWLEGLKIKWPSLI